MKRELCRQKYEEGRQDVINSALIKYVILLLKYPTAFFSKLVFLGIWSLPRPC